MRRLSLIDFLNEKDHLKYEICQLLKSISDLDRLMGKLAAEKISPKELGYLRQSLKVEKIEAKIKDESLKEIENMD